MRPGSLFRRVLVLLTAVALVAGLIAALVTAPTEPQDGRLLVRAESVADLAKKNPGLPPTELLARAGRGDELVRLLDAKGAVLAGGPPSAGDRVGAVAPVGAGSPIASVEVSAKAPQARELTVGRLVLVAGCGVALLCCVLAAMGASTQPRTSAAPAPPPAGRGDADRWLGPTAWEADGSRAIDERSKLVGTLIMLTDVSREQVVVDRAVDALRRSGVELIEPEPGHSFDPDTQSVSAVLSTEDDRLHDTVAAVVRPGYRDRDRVLRPADVQVYGASAQLRRT